MEGTVHEMCIGMFFIVVDIMISLFKTLGLSHVQVDDFQ